MTGVDGLPKTSRPVRLEDDVDDARLVERCAAGDDSAFDQIVLRYQDRVARLAYRLLGWQGDAEDVVQEVFLAAFKGLKRFRGNAQLSTWLTRITINKCHSYRRRNWRWWRRLEMTDDLIEPRGSDAAVLDRERFEQIREAIQRLPMKYREVVVLTYLEGMSGEAVAETLGIRRGTVDVRLHRARERLKVSLGQLEQH